MIDIQTIIFWAIIAISIVYIGRTIYKTLKDNTPPGGGCGGCEECSKIKYCDKKDN